MEFKNAQQLEKAKLEDALISLLYGRYNGLVFHGGTAIWRCYSGNRFSHDIDFYLHVPDKDRERLYREISEFLRECGFALKEKGYSRDTNTMHFLVESNTKMKVDINLGHKKGVPVEYARVDGSKMLVLSLTPEELLKEKIGAYESKMRNEEGFRQAEVQDLYDIYHLIALASKKDPATVRALGALVESVEKSPPPNVRSLDHLILSGVTPSLEVMVKRIKEWIA
jgi:predicted nucleotidyltransferase component of viral defense system